MEIFLKRPNSQVPWGFRIIGGSDSHLPIIVSKVLKNSVAEKSGLQEDIILERINNVPTSGLSHSEVNQVILAAEDELLLTIKRVNLETLILATLNEEESDSEISNILRQIINKDAIVEEDNPFQEEEEFEKMGLQREFETIIEPDRNQIPNRNIRNLPIPQPGKKWSTFLQKPQNPAPKDKNLAPPFSKESRYKVIITKQPKKEYSAPQITIDVPDENDEQQEFQQKSFISSEAQENFENQKFVDFRLPIENSENHDIDYQEENIEENEELQEDNHQDLEETPEKYEQEEDGDVQDEQEEANCEIKYIPVDTPSLEEQLAAVQKQLQELAQLPSTIQDTLSAVTQQLASIVANKVQENVTEDEGTEEKDYLEIATDLEEGDKELGSIEPGETVVEGFEEVSESAEMEGPQSEVLSDICEEQELSGIIEEEDTPQHLAEPLIEENKQEEITQKKQLENQLREKEETYKEKHSVRPIILPGGRKWVDPDDAVVKVDEWNRKWPWSDSQKRVYKINFLKYTPPPKNLEYLQRSEVYRLIHGMEPPVRGISLRSEKILAEQDYYTPGGN